MVSNPNEDLGLIYTKQEDEEPKQEGGPIIDDTTVVTIKSGKPFQLGSTTTSMHNMSN